MEIQKTDGQKPVKDYKLKTRRPLSEGPEAGTVQSSFLDELKRLSVPEAVSADVPERLEDLVAELDRQGRRLQERPVLEELVRYKALVKEFLERTVKRSLRAATRTFGGRLTRQRSYQIVEVVDRKLSELTLVVLDKERRNIDLAAKLDEIRGLLLDLYR